MGFTDFVNDTGIQTLESWLRTRSYITGYGPSQADVATFKALKSTPEAAKYPHAYRWYKHMTSHGSEFGSLPGDPSKSHSAYGPDQSEIPTNPKALTGTPTEAEDDEDDLFGSDESEDEEAQKVKEANLAAYKKKKEGKVKPAAKSIVTLDVKPWDDETDMKALEKNMRSIEMDGLTWGASKLVAVGYGISKLQVNLVVEDEKVSIDDLQGQIEGDEDHVQSTDVAAMQKL
ncbi:MAG: Translation elongation factor 1 beta [Alectoria sarmentosa]|nr:MAG: Translation elongation factor 1 beta [Alectoria sarmentosa]CAD6589825.1 MAG: Translation elongation factor 1 beta [Alectoria sarmentosa]